MAHPAYFSPYPFFEKKNAGQSSLPEKNHSSLENK